MGTLITIGKMTSMEIAEVTGKEIETIKCEGNCKGVVYIIKSEDQIKIGRTKFPHQRIRYLEKTSGRTFEKIALSPFCINFVQIESKMHKAFQTERKVGEWFSASYANAVNVLSQMEFNIAPVLPKENGFLKLFEMAMQMKGV